MQIGARGCFQLTYCTNIHPGNGWSEVFTNVQRYVPALKARLAPDRPFGLGLRLSGQESLELLQGDRPQRLSRSPTHRRCGAQSSRATGATQSLTTPNHRYAMQNGIISNSVALRISKLALVTALNWTVGTSRLVISFSATIQLVVAGIKQFELWSSWHLLRKKSLAWRGSYA
jgi:hypothetical protein